MFLYSLSVVKYIKLNNNIHNLNDLSKCITSINIIKICKPLYAVDLGHDLEHYYLTGLGL